MRKCFVVYDEKTGYVLYEGEVPEQDLPQSYGGRTVMVVPQRAHNPYQWQVHKGKLVQAGHTHGRPRDPV